MDLPDKVSIALRYTFYPPPFMMHHHITPHIRPRLVPFRWLGVTGKAFGYEGSGHRPNEKAKQNMVISGKEECGTL